MYRVSIAIIISLLIVSCSFSEKEVVITKDYIINPNWSKQANTLTVTRMRFKESLEIDINDVSPALLVQVLERDSTFMFTANVAFDGVEYAKRKIFFNKANGFYWRKFPSVDPSRSFKIEMLNELEAGIWYRLGGLSTISTLYYIYIDTRDSLHVIEVPASYWTNY